jgi:hypothetical protein
MVSRTLNRPAQWAHHGDRSPQPTAAFHSGSATQPRRHPTLALRLPAESARMAPRRPVGSQQVGPHKVRGSILLI